MSARLAITCLAVLLAQGCMASTVVLHVRPDSSGRATITTRLYLSGMRAFDGLFAAQGTAPRRPPQVEEELAAPTDGSLRQAFGTNVKLVSTRLDAATDGGIRTTDVDFDDIRKVQMPFPPVFAPGAPGGHFDLMPGMSEAPLMTMDEPRVRRMMSPGSFQEMLWQVGDLPGAIIPTETEVFLEYEGPPPQQTPPPQPAAPPPPDTEIYLAPLTKTNGELTVGTPSNITNSPGYDNQPFFTPDGRAILFASARTPTPALRDNPTLPQTDIWRYDVASKGISRVTQTPENEFSPTPMLDGVRISAVTVEADGTQRLYAIAPSGPKIQRDVILPDVKPVGYHAWADDHTLALFVLGGGQGIPATLQLADTRTGAARVVATDIGRSVQRMPGAGAARHISFVQRERNGDQVRLIVKELDPATGAIATLTPVVEGSREADLAWTPDGTLLMVKDDVLYAWTRGQSAWKDVTSFARSGVRGVTRLAVSPKGDLLALVASPVR